MGGIDVASARPAIRPTSLRVRRGLRGGLGDGRTLGRADARGGLDEGGDPMAGWSDCARLGVL
jgi:hypothetical protein